MDVKLYTGNGSTQTISGLGFSPDLVWYKSRSSSSWNHGLFDVIRGTSKQLFSNNTNAEGTYSGVTSFNSDGFTLGSDNGGNESGGSMVAWCWDAGTSTVTNTQGSITSSVRANATAGFSIVTWTGAGSSGTIGHGLGVEPHWIIVKNRTGSADNWSVYTKTSGAGKQIYLNLTDAVGSGSVFPSAPTSTVMTIGGGYVGSSIQSVAYCFAPVSGYSSFGSYTGNGSSDGPFVYTGFRPKWVLVKMSSGTSSWQLLDSARSDINVIDDALFPNLSNAETATSAYNTDFLSNGFKIRDADSFRNGNGSTFIYAAFAESPLNYSRAR
jgi:hypothetical protein